MSISQHRGRVRRALAVASCAAAAVVSAPAWAQSEALLDIDSQAQRDRAQREALDREQQKAQPDVRLGPVRATDFRRIDVPVERECFPLSSLVLEGPRREAFRFAQRYLSRYAGKCVGHDGVNVIVRRVSDMIIDRGFVTTRVGLAPQDLRKGVLRLTLVPGTVRAVHFAEGSLRAAWIGALPARVGDILNLRDIEQGLEQFKRVPSQDVTIDIAPGGAPGESDLVVSVKRVRPWRIVASLDDSGSRATGRLQAGVHFGLDNPLRINDVLSLGFNHDVYHSDGHGTRGTSASYNLPFGRWSFAIGLYDYQYHQTVEGSHQVFTSSGKSRTADLSVQRMIHRTRYGKTSLDLRVVKRMAHNFIEDTELLSQKRDVTSTELALVQRQYLGRAQLDLRLAQRRGVRWLGGDRDVAGRPAGAPTFQFRLNTIDVSLNVPLSLGPLPVQWTSDFRTQHSSDVLYGSDFIALGGRYTVRGFDGERTLAGEKGWYWRNALSVPLGALPVAAYVGVDGGHVGGPSIKAVPEKTLRGEFVGMRGNAGRFSFDLFAGWASKGGRALDTLRPATGFQLVYEY